MNRGLISIACFLLAALCRGQSPCWTGRPQPGGPVVAEREFVAPPQRLQEALEDAIQAVGFALQEVQHGKILGQRDHHSSQAGNILLSEEAAEVVFPYGATSEAAPVKVRVTTARQQFKRGEPKHCWSEAVLQTTACILATVSVGDPYQHWLDLRQAGMPPGTTEVLLPGGTSIPIVNRRCLVSNKLYVDQRVIFEVAGDVGVEGQVLIPKGSLVSARVVSSGTKGAWNPISIAAMKLEFAVSGLGEKIPVQGELQVAGESHSSALPAIAWGGVSTAVGALSGWYSYYGVWSTERSDSTLPAGTLFRAVVDGDHKIKVSPK